MFMCMRHTYTNSVAYIHTREKERQRQTKRRIERIKTALHVCPRACFAFYFCWIDWRSANYSPQLDMACSLASRGLQTKNDDSDFYIFKEVWLFREECVSGHLGLTTRRWAKQSQTQGHPPSNLCLIPSELKLATGCQTSMELLCNVSLNPEVK